MRITGGEFGGRILKVPKSDAIRPTQDRVREALFNIIQFEVPGADFLDLFAGSGAVGIEALSRGAAYADFYEKDRATARTIEANLKACGVSADRARVRNADVLTAFSGEAAGLSGRQPYGLVFLDPPYAFGAETVVPFIQRLHASGALAPDAVIAYEYAQKDAAALERMADGIDIIGMRKYGKTGVALLGVQERSVS